MYVIEGRTSLDNYYFVIVYTFHPSPCLLSQHPALKSALDKEETCSMLISCGD